MGLRSLVYAMINDGSYGARDIAKMLESGIECRGFRVRSLAKANFVFLDFPDLTIKLPWEAAERMAIAILDLKKDLGKK